MVLCGSCGARDADDGGFCATCGAYLGWTGAGPDPSAARPAAPPLPPEPPPLPAPEPAQHEAPLAGAPPTGTVAVLERVRTLADAQDRPDLSRQLALAQQRIEEQVVAVAVVGEFKRGKSTLVNALLQTAVCPVDADIVTALPTLVRYGDPAALTAYQEGEGEPVAVPLPLDDLAGLVSERGAPHGGRYRSVEVRLPHRLLRSGLCLVDTPGVGGLDSAHGLITLGALDTATATVFVTDASQELSGPELDFLRQAVERCPQAVCVMTKTDLYAEWRALADRDREHLQRAGLDLPVLPVSSFLRLRALREPALDEESGFADLVGWLGATVVGGATRAAEAGAVREARFVVGQVGRSVEAERAVLERPQQAERLVQGLTSATQRSAALVAGTATWQQLLTDRVQDMVAHVEHDLQERLRRVLREVETVIDQGDPLTTWTDIEVWLRRQVVSAAVANFDVLAGRAQDLAREVAEQFDLEARVPVDLDVGTPSEALDRVGLGSAAVLALPGGRVASLLLVARTASFLPMLMFGVAGSLLGVLVAPLSLALGAGIGAKIIRDERQRQVTYRRQQARQAARRYVDEVSFIIGKDSRDALRSTQRQLRDAFQARAAQLHRSTELALAAAQRARRLPSADRDQRAQDLAVQSSALRSLRDEVASAGGDP